MDDETIATLLGQIVEHAYELNDWEATFIDSVTKQFNNGRTLSMKQTSIIDKIHNNFRKAGYFDSGTPEVKM